MPKTRVGSQTREPIEETGSALLHLSEATAYVRNEDGDEELWTLRDDYAGYVLVINGKGYEFVRTLTDDEP